MKGQVHPLDFFAQLDWIDGRPLLDTIEPYRRAIFEAALWTFDAAGDPRFNLVLTGRGKKNWKTTDLILSGFYRFLCWQSHGGNDAFILANDEDQAGDDLKLAKLILAANPELAREVSVQAKEIGRLDGRGTLKILPARDTVGAHGKTYVFLGFDEIHGYKTHDLFEALAPDPTRPDSLVWVTSYQGIRNVAGIPIYDFYEAGKRGDDPRMFFSWYSADYCTDPSFAELEPELRANPSISSWPDGIQYLEQQKRRLPTHKYRRLHLNLPGAPDGAFLDQGAVLNAIVSGRRVLPYDPKMRYCAFVDMSGGSNDDATIAISHKHDGKIVIDLVASQAGKPPFNPRSAISKFAGILREYNISCVTGDDYAGETYKFDFTAVGISYKASALSKSELYEHFEPRLNAGEIELPDISKLQEQLLTLVIRGTKIDHQTGDHDDWANAVAGAAWLVSSRQQPIKISDAAMQRFKQPARWNQWGGRQVDPCAVDAYSLLEPMMRGRQ